MKFEFNLDTDELYSQINAELRSRVSTTVKDVMNSWNIRTKLEADVNAIMSASLNTLINDFMKSNKNNLAKLVNTTIEKVISAKVKKAVKSQSLIGE